jgi:hypothetical protein
MPEIVGNRDSRCMIFAYSFLIAPLFLGGEALHKSGNVPVIGAGGYIFLHT